ncbi:hypothetical protein GCM10011360_32440 [Primorskyibacter flagellatus]|uniref:SLC26A/SulP transporter domain-containing protein n=1 Tax=Primorskyibacter flagellatus TaxID=1387277 RepID=A0A917EJ03_9RHOB|nr:SulP family inorganic anion transporter [Primorskyibacter flagellatus]GGE42560.1 hypothetical protein GCM10011360_32440 [Primorskyibacter flagellatus]
MKPKLLTTLPTYDSAQFRADLIAGVTVAMVAIPLSIAIAIASGTTPHAGLITAVVGGFLISLLGGSRVQIGGPTGAFIVVVYGVVAAHGHDGLLLATLMAGAILLVAGTLRAGRLVRWVPEPVVTGFTLGIAAIIATSQFPDILGLTMQHVPADFLPKLAAVWTARDSLSWPALAVGVATIVLITTLRRLAPGFPGLIVAVALTSAAVKPLHCRWTPSSPASVHCRGPCRCPRCPRSRDRNYGNSCPPHWSSPSSPASNPSCRRLSPTA